MLLLRIKLPDRPGTLGGVASALGAVGADISSIQIVEKNADGSVIDDFMMTLPSGAMAEDLVSACDQIDNVEVLWISRYPDQWSYESELEVLDKMAAEPHLAQQTLTAEAPRVFHCQWAALVDVSAGRVLIGTDHAPELNAQQIAALTPHDVAHSADFGPKWLPGWGDVAAAVAPCQGSRALVLGRPGGPVFLDSEVVRLRHLAQLAN